MEEKRQQLQELKDMLESGLVTDAAIIESAKEEILRLEKEIAEGEEKQPEPAAEKPAPAKEKKTAAAPGRITEYSWKDKANLTELSPVTIHCQHYHLEAKEEMEVGLKGKGNATRKVPVKPGEHLIFDDKGYLVFVMDAESFGRKCIEQVTVKEHEQQKHQSEEAERYKKKYEAVKSDASRVVDKLKKEREELKGQVEELKGKAEEKPAAKTEEAPKPAAKKEEAPKAKEDPKPAAKTEKKPEPAPKASKPKAKAKPATKRRKKAKPSPKKKPAAATTPKADSKPEPKPASKPQAEPNPTIASIEKEVDDIRRAQGKKPLDRELFRKEYQDLAEKKDNKSYLAYIRKQLKQAQDEGVEFGEQEIINLGIAIRPLIQRKGAALLDILLTSKKVLAPTYDNLIRWTESPGRYDLQGVDISAKAKESVKAKKVEKPSLFDMIGL